MVEKQLKAYGITDKRVLKAMATVPREAFAPAEVTDQAYSDGPIPIGHGQTMSQPYVVALMLEVLDLTANDRVLEVGTGSGYNAALLSHLVKEVYTLEAIPELATWAQQCLSSNTNVSVYQRDGQQGLPSQAPFDAIIVTAAPAEFPPELAKQLAPQGRAIAPIGTPAFGQRLTKWHKDDNGELQEKTLGHVRFVPFIEKNP